MRLGDGRKFLMYLLTVLMLGLASNGLTAGVQAQSLDHTVPTHTTERFVTAGGTRLHYVDNGTGRPVVMIHGNAGDLRDFKSDGLDLLARNYRLLAFDLPGHGFSKALRKSNGTIQEQARFLHQALTALGIKNPILVGHSWGGAVVLAYAVLYPQDISALVLLAPAAYSDHHREAPAGFLLRVPLLGDLCIGLLKPLWGRRLLRNGLKNAFSPDPVPDDYLQAAATWLGREQIKTFLKNDATLNASLQDLSPQYHKIRAPVIIVTGDSDLVVSPQENAFRLHKSIANAELIVIPRAGHQIPTTQPRP